MPLPKRKPVLWRLQCLRNKANKSFSFAEDNVELANCDRTPSKGYVNQTADAPLRHSRSPDQLSSSSSKKDEARGTMLVELQKKEGSGLGLVVLGGTDKNEPSTVSYLRPGGIAQRSDLLEVGDQIISVNGIRTGKLKHDEIINLLKNTGENVILEIEYALPDVVQDSFSVTIRRVEIALEKEGNSFGFTLRGGMHPHFRDCRPHTVTQIRPGSSADREGTLKIDDRILSINSVCIAQLSLNEALKILHNVGTCTTLLVEYDVSVQEAVKKACGPLLVEIDKTPGVSLGLSLTSATYRGHPAICIQSIRPASIADRCGALHVGDELLTIDDTSLEHMTVAEASQLLKVSSGSQIRLEILPIGQQTKTKAVIESPPHSGEYLTPPGSNSSQGSHPQNYHSSGDVHRNYAMVDNIGSGSGVLVTDTVRRGNLPTMQHEKRVLGDSGSGASIARDTKHSSGASLSSGSSNTGPTYITNQQVCHTETRDVQLIADRAGSFGIGLQDSPFSTDGLSEPPIVAYIEPRSPCDRCGVIQEGDRVLAINGHDLENMMLVEVNKVMSESGSRVDLLIEFDVADSVVPSSGVFMVKLAKKGRPLGISIREQNSRKNKGPFIISSVQKGSVAHRTGTLQAKDIVLGIDSLRMHQCCMDEAQEALDCAGDIVRLRIQREDSLQGSLEEVDMVTYTVELEKRGGPLGLTISGTHEPFDPITISALTEAGLAEKTGALHVGDRILAINGHSLYGVNLSESVELLQVCDDTVTLKILRKLGSAASSTSDMSDRKKNDPDGDKYERTPITSADSALESWDSQGQDTYQSHNLYLTNPHIPHQHPLHSHSIPVPSPPPHVPGKPPLPPGARTQNNSKGQRYGNNRHDVLHNNIDYHSHLNPSVPPILESCETTPNVSPHGSIDADLWSRNLDNLDLLSTSEHSDAGSTSSFNLPDRKHSPDRDFPPPPECNHKENYRETDFPEDDIDFRDDSLSGHFSTSTKLAAEATLREVDSEMQNIFTPTAVELHRVSLLKLTDTDNFGFSLSDGVYEKGVYISMIRPGGPADRTGALRSYDRILEIHGRPIKDMDCNDVLPLIATSGRQMELVVSRNPLAQHQHHHPKLREPRGRPSSHEGSVISDVWKPMSDHKTSQNLISKNV